MTRRLAGLLMCCGMLPLLALAEERPLVEVTPGQARAYNGAVQRFIDRVQPPDAGRASELRLTIEEGLDFNGIVRPLDRAAYLGPDATLQLSEAPRSDCGDWTQSGADALIEGRLSVEEDEWVVAYQVWDTARCQRLSSGEVRAEPGNLTRLGREVADQASAAFTGVRGVSNTQIAFVSDRSGRRELYVMDADGNDVRAATNNRAVKAFPAWHPDGTAVLYTAHYDGQQPGLALSSRGALVPGLFLASVLPGAPKFRGIFDPQGESVAFVANVQQSAEIFGVRRTGQQLTRLTHSSAIEVSPSFSPDGKSIAFVSDRSGSPQIYIMNRDGRGARRLTFQGTYNTGPAWSPDGRWIAYETRLESQFDIWLIDPTGEVSFPLVEHPRSDETPSWAPNSRKLVFSSNRRGRYDLYAVEISGERLQRLTRDAGDNIQPAWGPIAP